MIGSKGFDYNTATPDEIRAECERRDLARKGYRGEAPATPAQVSRRNMELEKETQRRVIEVYVRAGCKVRSSSQPRKAKFMTPGSADLQIFSPAYPPEAFKWDDIGTRRRMWYHETKKPKDGRYSDEQLEFAADCRDAGIACLGGGAEIARQHLEKLGIPLERP